jgi:16S rRNA (guanine966-N2)-methyltransferase
LAALRSNIALLGFASTSVVASTVERFAQLTAEPFDVIFADPPYDTGSPVVKSAVEKLLANGATKAGTIVVVERSKRDTTWTWPESITGLRNKSYGEATFWYGQVD